MPAHPASATPSRSPRPCAWPPSCPGRHRHADAQRHHEGDRGELQGDLVRRQLQRADPSHDLRRGPEDGDLEQDREPDRDADPVDAAKDAPVGSPETAEDGVPAERRPSGDHPDHGQSHRRLGDGGAQTRAEDAEFGQAEAAEDQGVVDERVEGHGCHRDQQDHAGPLERGDVGSQHVEDENGEEPAHRPVQIGLRLPGQGGFLADRHQERLGQNEDRQGKGGEGHGGPQSLAYHTAHLAHPPAGDGRGGERRDRRADAYAQQHDGVEQAERQCRRRQRLRSVPAEHQHVGGADRQLTDEGGRQRCGQTQQQAAFHHQPPQARGIGRGRSRKRGRHVRPARA